MAILDIWEHLEVEASLKKRLRLFREEDEKLKRALQVRAHVLGLLLILGLNGRRRFSGKLEVAQKRPVVYPVSFSSPRCVSQP